MKTSSSKSSSNKNNKSETTEKWETRAPRMYDDDKESSRALDYDYYYELTDSTDDGSSELSVKDRLSNLFKKNLQDSFFQNWNNKKQFPILVFPIFILYSAK